MSYTNFGGPADQQQQQPPYPPVFSPPDYQQYPDPRAYQNQQPYAPTYNPADYPPPQSNPRPDVFSPPQQPPQAPPSLQQQQQPPSYFQTQQPPQQQNLYESAVNNAFDNSSVASQLPPEVIAKITEQVRSSLMDDLRSSGIIGNPPPPPQAQPYPPPPQAQMPPQAQVPQPQVSPSVAQQPFQAPPPAAPYLARASTASTTASSSIPSRANVYTPPSPDGAERGSSNTSPFGHQVEERYPPTVKDEPAVKFAEKEKSASVDSSYPIAKEDLSDRYGERERVVPPVEGLDGRPKKPVRTLTSEEETTLEKIWQPLFDDGLPTKRLGQFLRGLALHIIEDYEPKNSLVISPSKMRRFYDDVKLSSEPYPWKDIFSLADSQISRIYRDLKCEHHFIQTSMEVQPSVPALTPVGFQTWVTSLIQAHPDTEFDRLAKAVLDMPISNADERKERFPKELSRRLFPKYEDSRTRQRCVLALSAEGFISVPRSTSLPPPPQSSPPPVNGFPERKPQPYSHSQPQSTSRPASEDEYTSDDDGHTPLAVPIERERKPYTAKEGCGKTYEGGSSTSNVNFIPEQERFHRRTDSSTSGSGYMPPSASATSTTTGARLYRTNSNAARTTTSIPSTTSTTAGTTSSSQRRARSPSLGSDLGKNAPMGSYSRSDGLVHEIPSTYYTSNIYDDVVAPENSSDTGKRDSQYRHDDRDRDWDRRERERRDRSRGDEANTKERYERRSEWARRAEEEARYSKKYGDKYEDDNKYRKYSDDSNSEEYYRRHGMPPAPPRNYA